MGVIVDPTTGFDVKLPPPAQPNTAPAILPGPILPALTTVTESGVLNDNSGNLAQVINADSSATQISPSKAPGSGGTPSGTVAALPVGNAGNAGTSAEVSRGDHVHAIPAASESAYVANDDSGGLMGILNADGSGAQLAIGKVPSIPEAKLANDNSGEIAAIINADTSAGTISPAKAPGTTPGGTVTPQTTYGAAASDGTSAIPSPSDHDHGSVPHDDIGNLTGAGFAAGQFPKYSTTGFVPSSGSAVANSSACFTTVTPAAPGDGGDYATIQAAVDAIQAGTLPAGTVIIVVGSHTETTVTVGGTASLPTGGLTIARLGKIGQDASSPKITTLNIDSTTAKIESVYVYGFAIDAENWIGKSGGIVTNCAVENCYYQPSGGTSGITFQQINNGIQYVWHVGCGGTDKLVNTAGNTTPFIDVSGNTSSTGHLYFPMWQMTVASSSVAPGTLFQVENGTNLSPPVGFPLFDVVNLGNSNYNLVNIIGGTASTTALYIEMGPAGYVESGGVTGNIRPVTLVTIGAFTGGASCRTNVRISDVHFNAAGSNAAITAFNISNTSWGSGPSTCEVVGGVISSGGTSVFVAGTTGTFTSSFYCRIHALIGWNGYIGNAAPALTLSGANLTNTLPYRVRIAILTVGSATSYTEIDLNGTAGSSIPLAAGARIELYPQGRITFNSVTTAPTFDTMEADR